MANRPQPFNEWFSPKAYLLIGGVVLWWQDWQLLLAVSAGVLTMTTAYLYQQGGTAWRRKWKQELLTVWRSPHRPLILSVALGSLAVLTMQVLVTIWVDVPNHWLAFAMTSQLLITLAVLGLLLRQAWQRSMAVAPVDDLLEKLMEADLPDRLFVLRQLYQQMQSEANQGKHLPPAQQQMLIDICETVEELELVDRGWSSPKRNA
jgi:hypothetical protein